MLESLCEAAIDAGYTEFLTLLLVGFYGLLRIGEVFGLHCGDCSFSDSNKQVVLTLRLTKTSKPSGGSETVVIDNPLAVACLKIMCEAKLPGQPVFAFSYYQFRKTLTELLHTCGLQEWYITVHSLRRGGATYLFQLANSYHHVAEIGRWSSLKACRLYVQQAVAEAADLNLTSRRLNKLRARFRELEAVLEKAI